MKDQKTKRMVLIAMLAAVSYLVVSIFKLFPIQVIPALPFLSFEPKDVIITIGGFIMGPLSSAAISLLVSLLEMVTISGTGPIGALMNLVSTCAFACTAAFIYKKKRTIGGAVIGLVAGSVTMVAVMLLWNWLITPLYMGVDREAVESLLLPGFLPFNALKAGLNSALTIWLYKPLTTALGRTGLIEAKPKRPTKLGIYLFAAALLISCILLLLVLQGRL